MKLFQSATLKLAGWYLLILMTVSLLFSAIIFEVARSEVETRFELFSNRQDPTLPNIPQEMTHRQLEAATASLLASLGYLNLIVLLAGGTGAYFLARRTLGPIEAAHEAQARFVANASHQLRTPLAIIKAETELALSSPKTKTSELRQTLNSNLEEINHLTELSGMLLELSRNEKSLTGTKKSVDLVKIIRQVNTKRHINKRIKLSVPDKMLIISHRIALREIYAVLIDNAVKHSPAESPIVVEIKPGKNCLILAVTNSGAGISRQQLPHIFERFYRANSESEGYGLGLSLARQLTEAIGGKISVTSVKNQKTTFCITLPLNFS